MNKNNKALFLLVSLGIVLLLSLMLVRQRQELRKGAMLSTASVLIQPENVTIEKGKEQTVRVFLDPKGAKLSTYDLYFCYDPNVVGFVTDSITVLKSTNGLDVYSLIKSESHVIGNFMPDKDCLRVAAHANFEGFDQSAIRNVLINKQTELFSFKIKGLNTGKTDLMLNLTKQNTVSGELRSYLSGINPNTELDVKIAIDTNTKPMSIEVISSDAIQCTGVDYTGRSQSWNIDTMGCESALVAAKCTLDGNLGKWTNQVPCVGNNECDNGACVPKFCKEAETGTKRAFGYEMCDFSNTHVIRCETTGDWRTIERCLNGCTNGVCNDPVETQCQDAVTTAQWVSVAMSSDGKYQTAVAGDYNFVYVSNDYGVTWVPKNNRQEWIDIAMSSDGKYQIATYINSYGFYSMSSDYGVTWTKGDNEWNGGPNVAMSSDGKIQTIVLTGSNLYVSTDYGKNWTQRSGEENWFDVAMSSDGKYQTAVGHYVYISADYGKTWTVKINEKKDWRGVGMSADGKYQTALNYDDSGTMYVSTDYGNTWTKRNGYKYGNKISMSSDGKYQTIITTITEDAGSIYKSTDYGNTWTQKGNKKSYMDVSMSSDGKYQTTVAYGKIHSSFDYGENWKQIDIVKKWNINEVGCNTNDSYATCNANGVWGQGTSCGGKGCVYGVCNKDKKFCQDAVTKSKYWGWNEIGCNTTDSHAKCLFDGTWSSKTTSCDGRGCLNGVCNESAGKKELTVYYSFKDVNEASKCSIKWPVAIEVMSADGKYKSVFEKVLSIDTTATVVIGNDKTKVYKAVVEIDKGFVGTGAIFIKGPKHLRTKFGINNQSEYYNKDEGQLSFAGDKLEFNFSKYPILGGDIADEKQDGVVDALDFSYIKKTSDERNVKEAGGYMASDLNGDCKNNAVDQAVLLKSLIDKLDQIY